MNYKIHILVIQYEYTCRDDVNGHIQADVINKDKDRYTFTSPMVTKDMIYEQYNTVMNLSYLLFPRDPQAVK